MKKLCIIFALGVLSCVQPATKQTINTKPAKQINKNAPFYGGAITMESPRISKKYDSPMTEFFYPFLVYKDGTYMVAAEIDGEKIDEDYRPLFEKYGYEGSGFDWYGLIFAILKKEQPSLLPHLHFDPEGGGFYLFADSEESQYNFAIFMSGVFKDKIKIDNYLKTTEKKVIEKALDGSSLDEK